MLNVGEYFSGAPTSSQRLFVWLYLLNPYTHHTPCKLLVPGATISSLGRSCNSKNVPTEFASFQFSSTSQNKAACRIQIISVQKKIVFETIFAYLCYVCSQAKPMNQFAFIQAHGAKPSNLFHRLSKEFIGLTFKSFTTESQDLSHDDVQVKSFSKHRENISNIFWIRCFYWRSLSCL